MSVFRPGATAVITGGASGVGFAFAQLCRKHHMHLALLDIDSANLSKAAEALKTSTSPGGDTPVKTETYTLDVGNSQSWSNVGSELKKTFDSIDLLMLNAGSSFKPTTSSPWLDGSYFEKTMSVNLFGVIYGLSTLLPLVTDAGSSSTTPGPKAIVLTGSKQGITNPPGNPAYNASKAAIKSLAENLAHEMRSSASSSTPSIHLLIPGWTFTGLSGNAGPVSDSIASQSQKKGSWLPSQVAAYARRKIDDNVFYIVCPDDDVDESLDQARMAWGAADWVEGRGALTRWDDKWKDEAKTWIDEEAERRRGKERK